jgi:nicotinamidase/pyrazinamidase
MKQALIVVDVQRDFCDGGVLPAKDTSSLISPLNYVIASCMRSGILCVFTRDWHPPDHCSFHSQGGPWPPHCIQGTLGAEFADDLQFPDSGLVIDIEKDSNTRNMGYSAFENTNLAAELRNRHIQEIAACGIATEYCVKATVMDALRSGFRVSVLTDLVRPIDISPNDSSKALAEMIASGAMLLTSNEWLKHLESGCAGQTIPQ